jgi:hypothetical protein
VGHKEIKMKGQPSTTIPKLDEYNLDKIEKNLVSTLMTTYPNAPIREIADVIENRQENPVCLHRG